MENNALITVLAGFGHAATPKMVISLALPLLCFVEEHRAFRILCFLVRVIKTKLHMNQGSKGVAACIPAYCTPYLVVTEPCH